MILDVKFVETNTTMKTSFGESYGEGGTGQDGFSPIATVTQIDNGAKISITDINGTTEATVLNGKDGADGKNGENGKDGADGKDGYTPVKGVDYFDGKDGANGEDGYTPQKGIDYMTPEDIKEIAKQVESPAIDESNLVHKTELEEIYGVKMFYDGIDTPKISYDGNIEIFNSYGASLKLDYEGKVLANEKEVATKEETKNYIDEQTNIIKSDVEGLQKQLNEEAHFKGYLSTNAKIQALEATPNDFAYSAESGTKWVYDAENGWQDTGTPVPDQLTPASNATPLVNGEASAGQSEEYARGDHRHPTDTTRASVEEFNAFKTEVNASIQKAIGDVLGGAS